MSKRLTSDWTKNTEQAFGETGAIGDHGERNVMSYLREMFPDAEIIQHQSDYNMQTSGIDITVNGVGIDVKTNLHTGRNVVVEKPTLMKSKAMFWLHWNREDKNDGPVIYKVKDMQHLVKDWPANGRDQLVFVPRHKVP